MEQSKREVLDYLNVAGTWLSGIATTGAVVVSLWLARQSGRVNIRVRAHLTRSVLDEDRYAGLSIEVTNLAERTVRLTGLYWEFKGDMGLHRSHLLALDEDDERLPVDLPHGHQVKKTFQCGSVQLDRPLGGVTDWLSRSTLRLCVETTVGVVAKWKPDPEFIEYVRRVNEAALVGNSRAEPDVR